jgi:hypothetical protein
MLQYAGNVLVYGPASPCDGDWYGGVTADSAETFLDALFGADVASHGGVSEPALRPLWRGRMGLTKEEQVQVRPVVTLHHAGGITAASASSQRSMRSVKQRLRPAEHGMPGLLYNGMPINGCLCTKVEECHSSFT